MSAKKYLSVGLGICMLAAVAVCLRGPYIRWAEKQLSTEAFRPINAAAEQCLAAPSVPFSPDGSLSGGELLEPGLYATPFFEYYFPAGQPCFLEVYRIDERGSFLYALNVSPDGTGTPIKHCYAYSKPGISVCRLAQEQGFISILPQP